MNLEDLLRQALEPPEPPPGFAERVVARLTDERAAPRGGRSLIRWLVPSHRWLVPVAALMLIAIGAGRYEVHRRAMDRRAMEGERAKAQVLAALEITRDTLHVVQRSVRPGGGRVGGEKGEPQ